MECEIVKNKEKRIFTFLDLSYRLEVLIGISILLKFDPIQSHRQTEYIVMPQYQNGKSILMGSDNGG
jgi:hypothetical protein